MIDNKQVWTFPDENLQFENEEYEGGEEDCHKYDEESEEGRGDLGN